LTDLVLCSAALHATKYLRDSQVEEGLLKDMQGLTDSSAEAIPDWDLPSVEQRGGLTSAVSQATGSVKRYWLWKTQLCARFEERHRLEIEGVDAKYQALTNVLGQALAKQFLEVLPQALRGDDAGDLSGFEAKLDRATSVQGLAPVLQPNVLDEWKKVSQQRSHAALAIMVAMRLCDEKREPNLEIQDSENGVCRRCIFKKPFRCDPMRSDGSQNRGKQTTQTSDIDTI
jgi:hypothetical protein